MALPPYGCEPDQQVCCSALYLTAEHLLNVVMVGQLACQPSGCGTPELLAYVGHGMEPEDPLCDTLVVWVASVQPSPGSSDRVGKTFLTPVMRATYRIRLVESGAPMPTASEEVIYAPHPSEHNFAALHGYSHGERMLRDIVNAHSRNELVPQGCGFVALGQFYPLQSSGGCMGWRVDVTVDVPWELQVSASGS